MPKTEDQISLSTPWRLEDRGSTWAIIDSRKIVVGYVKRHDIAELIVQTINNLAVVTHGDSMFCEVCNSPLSQCGKQSVDGEPTLDCRVCVLANHITNLDAYINRIEKERDDFQSRYHSACDSIAENCREIGRLGKQVAAMQD